MFLKILVFILILVTEIPLAYKCHIAIKEYNFSRQAAIVVLMIITALIIAGIYKLGLFVLGLG